MPLSLLAWILVLVALYVAAAERSKKYLIRKI